MFRWLKFVFVISIITSAASAIAQDSSTNPFVILYKKRLEMAKNNVETQARTVEFERIRAARLAELANIGAVSRKEAQDQQAIYGMSKKMLEMKRLEQNSADAYLRIAVARIESGLNMEICPAVIN